jgi:hypothetical protein
MIERSTWRAKLNPLPHLAVLVGLPLLISIAAIAGLPFSRPMPDYWSDANQLATTGRITQHFEPSGYAAFLAAGIKLGGRRPEFGVEVLQTLLAMLTVLIAWALMRRLGASQLAALTGACVIALHPELVVTVTKVWDVTLSTTLLLLIVFPPSKSCRTACAGRTFCSWQWPSPPDVSIGPTTCCLRRPWPSACCRRGRETLFMPRDGHVAEQPCSAPQFLYWREPLRFTRRLASPSIVIWLYLPMGRITSMPGRTHFQSGRCSNI